MTNIVARFAHSHTRAREANIRVMTTGGTITRTRADLYDEVWTEPLRDVAKRYGISDVALGKICRKLGVPLPGRGYWARTAAGKVYERPALPPAEDGEPLEVAITPRVGRDGGVDPEVRARVAAEKAKAAIVVAAKLVKPHPLVAAASSALRANNRRSTFDSAPDARCLDIEVSPASLDRALRIMNALVGAFDERSLRVEVVDAKTAEARGYRRGRREARGATCVRVDDEWIVFGLSERGKVQIVPPEPPKGLRGEKLDSWLSWNRARREIVPDGRLMLLVKNADFVSTRKVWQDARRQRLEDIIGDFVAHLHVTAAAIRDYRLERERWHREWEEGRRRHEEELERERREREREEAFLAKLDDWERARQIREYVDAARAVVRIDGDVDEEMLAELDWALEFADRLDPLVAFRERSTPV